jgi:hypothetical protein
MCSGLNSNTRTVHLNFLTSTPANIDAHTIDVVKSGSSTIIYANAGDVLESISGQAEDMMINLAGLKNLTVNDFILHH